MSRRPTAKTESSRHRQVRLILLKFHRLHTRDIPTGREPLLMARATRGGDMSSAAKIKMHVDVQEHFGAGAASTFLKFKSDTDQRSHSSARRRAARRGLMKYLA